MQQLKYTCFILLSLLLTACSRPTPIQYYQLPDSAYQLPEKHSQTIGVAIQLAQPLQNASLLYQTDAYTLNFARQNLWAAPLLETLTISLTNKLNRSGSLKYIPASHIGQTNLLIYIDRFQGSYTGETEISGYAQWQNGQQIPFHIKTPQQGDGYPAMLASLNQGLITLAEKIAR